MAYFTTAWSIILLWNKDLLAVRVGIGNGIYVQATTQICGAKKQEKYGFCIGNLHISGKSSTFAAIYNHLFRWG